MKQPAKSTWPKDVDGYIARLPADQAAALTKLRRQIKAAAPGLTESISYGLATFKLDGHAVIYFGAAKAHCAIYGPAIDAFAAELDAYERTGKGTVRFAPAKPLPQALVTRLVKRRVAQIKKEGR